MKEKLKVITVVGTRPEIIRLSQVIKKLDLYCDHILIHTGQNYDYELNQIFFNDLGLRNPDYYLNAATPSPSQTIGNIIIEVDKLFEKIMPDAVLVLGDTNSCLSLLPAKRRKIPTFHMEAGNRCFDLRVPEEINRKIVDHLADINMTYSGIAREYLLREGIKPEMVIKTGSPMYEVLKSAESKINASNILDTLSLRKNKYFVISSHREENIDSSKNLDNLLELIELMVKRYGLPIIMPLHPRTKIKFQALDVKLSSLVKIIKPLGFFDYNKLQKNSLLVLSDSGTISEESIIQKFNALNIRETHERPEAMEGSPVIMTGMSTKRIIQSIDMICNMDEDHCKVAEGYVADYNIPNVSEKVLKIIISYVDYINTFVWKK